jgi:hypothetical protein
MGNLTLSLVLIVRIYDSSGLSDLDRRGAVNVAAEILEAANVPTTWPDCRPAPTPHPKPTEAGKQGNGDFNAFVCAQPMEGSEFAVRIVRDSAGSHPAPSQARADRQPLGYALVDPERGGGALATVYLKPIRGMAAGAATPTPVLLGRAIAHEIGHLLLGDNSHTAEGLMRAVWSLETMRRNAAADWRFSDEQATALQLALERAQGLVPCASIP